MDALTSTTYDLSVCAGLNGPYRCGPGKHRPPLQPQLPSGNPPLAVTAGNCGRTCRGRGLAPPSVRVGLHAFPKRRTRTGIPDDVLGGPP